MRYSKEESKMIWDQNAEFWDYTMGDESNDFHRNVVRPKVTELLNPNSSDYILDIACGNGNYSAYLAEKGISVVGFDYGEKMIELAKKRRKHNTDRIEFYVADATNEISMKTLKRNRMFTKAVSNMADGFLPPSRGALVLTLWKRMRTASGKRHLTPPRRQKPCSSSRI